MIDYLSHEDFLSIYSRVPRLCVDLIITSEEGVLLSLRAIEPYLGQWHFPGGTVYKGETIEEAAKRVAKKRNRSGRRNSSVFRIYGMAQKATF